MNDWVAFTAGAQLGSQDSAIERDAEALIQRLEAFGSKVSCMNLSPRRSSAQGERVQSDEKVTSPASSVHSKHSSLGSPDQSLSLGDSCEGLDGCRQSSPSCDGSTVPSDERAVNGQRAPRRPYAQAKVRQQRAASDKENAARSAPRTSAPQINPRSKAMQRSGSIGDRLHQEALSKAARQEAIAEEIKRRKMEEMKARDEEGYYPAINEVSASLMRERSGDVVDRLYGYAKNKDREQQAREAIHQQQIQESARPEISTGSQRIAALLPDRNKPVQERLYAEASTRQAQLSAASQVRADESFQPQISAHSRRLAERVNQGLPLEERLSRSYGKTCETSSELLECVHAPTVNPKSEQLVHERLLRQGIDERVPVEDRLLAEANKPKQVIQEPEHIPKTNPNSARILQRRGAGPVGQRLQQGIRNTRAGVSLEAEACSYQPSLSKGSQKLLAKKEHVPVHKRLLEWGAKRVRGEGNSDLADARFRFGPAKCKEQTSPRASLASPNTNALEEVPLTPRTAKADHNTLMSNKLPTPILAADGHHKRDANGRVSPTGTNSPKNTSSGGWSQLPCMKGLDSDLEKELDPDSWSPISARLELEGDDCSSEPYPSHEKKLSFGVPRAFNDRDSFRAPQSSRLPMPGSPALKRILRPSRAVKVSWGGTPEQSSSVTQLASETDVESPSQTSRAVRRPPVSSGASRSIGSARSPAVPFTAKRPKRQSLRSSSSPHAQWASKIPLPSPKRQPPPSVQPALITTHDFARGGAVDSGDADEEGEGGLIGSYGLGLEDDAVFREEERASDRSSPLICNDSHCDETTRVASGAWADGSNAQIESDGVSRSTAHISSVRSSEPSDGSWSHAAPPRKEISRKPRRLVELLEDAEDALTSPPAAAIGRCSHSSECSEGSVERGVSPEAATRLHAELSAWTQQFEGQRATSERVGRAHKTTRSEEGEGMHGKPACEMAFNGEPNEQIPPDPACQLATEVAELKAQVTALRARCEQSERDAEGARIELDESRRRSHVAECGEASCRERLREVEAQNERSEAALAATREEIASLRVHCELEGDTASSATQLQTELRSWERRACQAEEELVRSQGELRSAEGLVKEAKQEKSRLLRECEDLRKARAEAAAHFSDERERLESQLHAALEELATERAAVGEERRAVEMRVKQREAEQEAKRIELVRALEQHTQQLEHAERQAKENKRTHALEIQDLIRGRDEAEQMVHKLERRLESMGYDAKDYFDQQERDRREQEERKEEQRREAARRVLEARRQEMRREAAQREAQEQDRQEQLPRLDTYLGCRDDGMPDPLDGGGRLSRFSSRTATGYEEDVYPHAASVGATGQSQVKTERIREELHRVEEDQLGAALRARRKKRELESMSRQVRS